MYKEWRFQLSETELYEILNPIIKTIKYTPILIKTKVYIYYMWVPLEIGEKKDTLST